MRTLRLLAFVVLLGSATTARAQLSYYGTATYQLAFPIGETHQYIHDVAWRGVGLDFGYFVRPNITVGFAVAWNVFYEGTNRIVHFSNGGDISGYQDRSLNVFPILANARYFFEVSPSIRPFVGFGMGVYPIIQRLDIGLSSYSTTEWHFGIAPELGVFVPIGLGSYGTLSVRYNLPFSSGSQGFYQFIGVHLGIGWGNGL
jgi:hypothetical protein